MSRGDDNEGVHIPENAEQLLNAESIEQLCQFLAWGHTNGVQVGNLLTTVLKDDQMLLTDGTDAGPGGVGAETVKAAADASCPQVWFLARTGRIPPPEESVRGPFRVSELTKMMQEGDLSPFDLVTATHVESYDDDDESSAGSGGALKEANIDTGKWKRIEQGKFMTLISSVYFISGHHSDCGSVYFSFQSGNSAGSFVQTAAAAESTHLLMLRCWQSDH